MSIDDFLYNFGRPRFCEGKIQIDLDLRYEQSKDFQPTQAAVEKLLDAQGLKGSIITVGY